MTDQPTLRDRIAAAIYATYGQQDRNRSRAIADAVLAVLPAPVDRVGDGDRLQNKILELEADPATVKDLLRTENKRANDAIDREETAEQAALEAQQDRAAVSAALWAVAEHHTVSEWICCEPIEPEHELCAQGAGALRMLMALLVDDPEAHKPAPLLDEVMRLVPPVDRAAVLREAASAVALDRDMTNPGGGKGRRAMDRAEWLLRRMADEAQQPKEARR